MKRLVLYLLIGVTCIVNGALVIDLARGVPANIDDYITFGSGIVILFFSHRLLKKSKP